MTPRLVRLCVVLASSALVHNALAQNPPPATPPPASPPPLGNNPGAPQPPPAAQPAANPPAAGAASAAPVTGVLRAASGEDDPVQLNLPDADLETVLSALEIYTGKIIIRPAQLTTASYNIRIKKPIPKSEAIRIIETVLALNQIGIAPLDDMTVKVVNLQLVKSEAPEMITGSTLDLPPSGKPAAKIFQLEFLRVAEFLPTIQQGVLNPFYGQPVILQNANAALITDSLTNLQRVERLLQQLDRPVTAGMKPKFYQLKNGAKASDLVTKLRTILTGTLQQQVGSATTFSADDRTNQVILVTDPRQHAFFDELIDRLDQRSDPNTRVDVIYLKHAKAADMVTVLGNIIRGQTQALQQRQGSVRPGAGTMPMQPTPGAAPVAPNTAGAAPNLVSANAGVVNADGTSANEFSAAMTVVNDERSNSIVVSGTADDLRLVRELVDKLDIVLSQVRIEVVIAEVTLDDNHDSGISNLGLKLDGDRLVGFSTSGPSFNLTGDGNSSIAGISRIGGPGSLGRSLDLSAIISLNTTKRKNNTTILTVPAITASHGKQAVINDGETRPVISGVTTIPGAATGATTSSQINQQQIGTTLTVTPFIGIADSTVQLEIQQELTDVIDTVTVDNNKQYVIGTRKATTYITARSGEIHVLGGFRKKIDSRQTNRLGPIPIIGDLFGQRHKDQYHQELIFFLRPVIITNDAAVDNAETMKKVEGLPARDEIKQQLDPNYKPAPSSSRSSVLDKILPK